MIAEWVGEGGVCAILKNFGWNNIVNFWCHPLDNTVEPR